MVKIINNKVEGSNNNDLFLLSQGIGNIILKTSDTPRVTVANNGITTFAILPECSSIPSSNNQLVNKSYVDEVLKTSQYQNFSGSYNLVGSNWELIDTHTTTLMNNGGNGNYKINWSLYSNDTGTPATGYTIMTLDNGWWAWSMNGINPISGNVPPSVALTSPSLFMGAGENAAWISTEGYNGTYLVGKNDSQEIFVLVNGITLSSPINCGLSFDYMYDRNCRWSSTLGVGQGRWVITGKNISGKNIRYSDNNGSSWNEPTSINGFGSGLWLEYANGRFIAGGTSNISGNSIMYSSNGINWEYTTADIFKNGESYCGAYSPSLNRWVSGGGNYSVSDNANAIVYSDNNGTSWNVATNGSYATILNRTTNSKVSGISWSESLQLFVAVCSRTSNQTEYGYWTSPDGLNWTSRNAGNHEFSGVYWSDIAQAFIISVIGSNTTRQFIYTTTGTSGWSDILITGTTGNRGLVVRDVYVSSYGGATYAPKTSNFGIVIKNTSSNVSNYCDVYNKSNNRGTNAITVGTLGTSTSANDSITVSNFSVGNMTIELWGRTQVNANAIASSYNLNVSMEKIN